MNHPSPTTQAEDYPDIEDHGIIGDLRTAALVCLDGTIDFLCLPRFDSPSLFASLLDAQRGGHFKISPVEGASRYQQKYLPETNVLLTRFLSHDGLAEIVDFMPPAPEYPTQALIRVVRGVRQVERLGVVLEPRFDYARAAVTIERVGEHEYIITPEHQAKAAIRLRSPIDLEISQTPHGPRLRGEFTIHGGELLAFVLESAELGDESPFATLEQAQAALEGTVQYWRRWSAKVDYSGRWSEMVQRSALLLKLLTSHEHGAIIAAPTFSLPERIGGLGNWDYRYCWIRDTAFAMQALTRLGLREDAWALARWLEQRCEHSPDKPPIEVFYTASGDSPPAEQILESLAGYRGTGPVHIGNAAQDQLQLDVSGELINALHTYDRTGSSLPHGAWETVTHLLDDLSHNWRRPDHGIWELRGAPRERLHSRVMCWIAFDRGIRLARGNGRPAPIERWRAARDEIYRDIWDRFWDEDWGAFRATADERCLDAASLVMPLLGFSSSDDPKWRAMLGAVRAGLVEDSLVFRIAPSYEGAGHPGTFSLCSFWYVECLSHAQELREARNNLEKMLRYANHLGLFAEQLGPCGEHLGNFPQALTHIGLINAAVNLNSKLDGTTVQARRQRAQP